MSKRGTGWMGRRLRGCLLAGMFLVSLHGALGLPQGPDTDVPGRGEDSAITRARGFLETPLVKYSILQAIHWKSLSFQMEYVGAMEDEVGASLVYSYTWLSPSDLGTSGCAMQSAETGIPCPRITIHISPLGRVDSVDVAGDKSADAPFTGFSEYLNKEKKKAVDKFVDKVVAGDEQPDTFDHAVMDVLRAYAKNVGESIMLDGQGFLTTTLGLEYDAVTSGAGLPGFGMDGLRFMTRASVASRTMNGTAAQVRSALPLLLKQHAAAAQLGDLDYSKEAAEISDMVDACLRITAETAIGVSMNGGYGPEQIAKLGEAFRPCGRDPHALQSLPYNSTALTTRPLVFEFGPAGGNWKDASGVRLDIRFKARPSDPEFTGDGFDEYGALLIRVLQPSAACTPAQNVGLPDDHIWRDPQTGTGFRIRFECEHALIYLVSNHALVADLTAVGDARDVPHLKFRGTGPMPECSSGSGRIELDHLSNQHAELSVEGVNRVNQACGGAREGMPFNSLFHANSTKYLLNR